jgi:hypothetical protein
MILFEFYLFLLFDPYRARPKTTLKSDARLRARPPPSMVAYPALNHGRKNKMARKPAARVEYTLFDVVYEDGSQRSNRRVPSEVLGGLDGDAPARAVIEEQDRIIAERSGTPPLAVKSIHRSGSKKAEEAARSSPQATDR